jgi:hypothetical protein
VTAADIVAESTITTPAAAAHAGWLPRSQAQGNANPLPRRKTHAGLGGMGTEEGVEGPAGSSESGDSSGMSWAGAATSNTAAHDRHAPQSPDPSSMGKGRVWWLLLF